jgi:hypothetical protein
MEHRINTLDFGSLEEWTRFTESRANDIQLTTPRLVKIENMDIGFRGLFDDLVEIDTKAKKAAN